MRIFDFMNCAIFLDWNSQTMFDCKQFADLSSLQIFQFWTLDLLKWNFGLTSKFSSSYTRICRNTWSKTISTRLIDISLDHCEQCILHILQFWSLIFNSYTLLHFESTKTQNVNCKFLGSAKRTKYLASIQKFVTLGLHRQVSQYHFQ